MEETLPIEVIRLRYRYLMNEIYQCFHFCNAQRLLEIKTRINMLLYVLVSREDLSLGSREIIHMKTTLHLMRNKLMNLPVAAAPAKLL